MLKIKLVECGCCGAYHPAQWFGDCRSDRYRILAPELLCDATTDIKIVDEDDPDSDVTDDQFTRGPVLFSRGVVRPIESSSPEALEQALDRYHAAVARGEG